MAAQPVKIGVLALQGDFALHIRALQRCGADTMEIRKPEQLGAVDGLIIPGGESTTLLKLMDEWGFVPALDKFAGAGKPMFGKLSGCHLDDVPLSAFGILHACAALSPGGTGLQLDYHSHALPKATQVGSG